MIPYADIFNVSDPDLIKALVVVLIIVGILAAVYLIQRIT